MKTYNLSLYESADSYVSVRNKGSKQFVSTAELKQVYISSLHLLNVDEIVTHKV